VKTTRFHKVFFHKCNLYRYAQSPGWMESAMPGSKDNDAGEDEDGAYSYRYYNVGPMYKLNPVDPLA
jgi:hypothetical protein